MKKLFFSMAAAALAMTASAADWTYTVDPKEGEVEMLQFVTLTFPNVDEIEINSKDDITVTRDGENVRGVSKDVENDTELHLVFGAEQTLPGTYKINIPAGTLAGYADNYAWMEDNEDIVLTYEIKSQGGGASQLDWSYFVAPEAGEVTEIREIQLMFPEIEEVEINTKDDITLSFNGKSVAGIKIATVDEQTTSITPAEPLTEAGTYVLSIPAYTLAGYDFSNDLFEDNPEDIEITWTIASSGNEDTLDFKYVSSLPTEGYLAYFGELTLEFTEVEKVSYNGSGITVSKDGEALSDVTVATDTNKLTITLKDALNFVDGTVDVVIAAEALTAVSGTTTAANKEAIEISYKMATPVEYDLTLAISTPKPNSEGQISAEKSLTSIYLVCEEKDLVAASGTAVNATIKSEEGDFEASCHLRKSNGLNQNYTYFTADFNKEPRYNGKYVITIDKGAFGTAAWAEDPNYGHSNDVLELTFELIDGADRKVYTLLPTEITPEEGTYEKGTDISKVTVKFADGITAMEDASATLAGIDNSYSSTAEFKADAEGGYTVTFDPAPTEEGSYQFTVEPGAFGDASFVANGIGKGSAAISISYKIDRTNGISTVDAVNGNGSIYNMQGIKINSSANELPAGLYIIDGKKVIVKK